MMKTKKLQKNKLMIWVTVLILASLSCGSFKVGVVTPTPEGDLKPVSEDQAKESDSAALEVIETPIEDEAVMNPVEVTPEVSSSIQVVAWLGHIASLPQSSQFDDMLVLSPAGTGELGMSGATPELEAEIRSLRDAEGPQEWVHLWGEINCPVNDYNGCQLLVDKLQYGANYSEEEVVDWVGTIKQHTFNGGDSSVFELSGDFPMWYSIHASQDQELQSQIEQIRDTGALVKVSGQLLVGIPDVNGTRIEVSSLEVIEPGTNPQPTYQAGLEISADWPVFVNERYGYQIKYPMNATISLFGPVGFSAEDLPEGMTPDQYMDSLLKEYTNQLCVRIEYSLGWIYIAAPPNAEKHLTPCGPTGLGAGEIIDRIETIAVGDQVYQANGVEFRLHTSDSDGNPIISENLDIHGEMFGIQLEDGTVIRYGSNPRHDATYEDYLMKTRETLLQILATYQPES